MKKILIFRIGGVGDTLLLLPFISALRETYPEAHLEFIGYPERIQIFKDFGYVNEIRSFDQSGISFLFSNDSEPAQKSTIEYLAKFDTIFVFLKDEDGNFVRNLKKCKMKNFYLFNPFPRDNQHILDYYENLSRSLGLNNNNKTKYLFLQKLGKNPDAKSEPTVAIHPGAGSRKKCWPTKYFAEIIDWLAEKYQIGGNHLKRLRPALRPDDLRVRRKGLSPKGNHLKTLLISGPADEEVTREVIQHLKKTSPEIIKNLTLTELALLLNRCSFYLGNDSGITHLSAFTGTPTIAIFNQENAKTWSPRGENIYLCASDELEKISPLEVKEKISNLL